MLGNGESLLAASTGIHQAFCWPEDACGSTFLYFLLEARLPSRWRANYLRRYADCVDIDLIES